MSDVDDVDEVNEGEDEQIDIEEARDTDTLLFDHETFIRKLREKPTLPPTPKDCGTTWPKKSYKDWKAPVAERLSVPTLSTLDVLKQQIPFPKGTAPPLSLPAWHFTPLEKRIPYLTAGKDLVYYTRGKLGKRLIRKTTYSTKDPFNVERVPGIPGDSYNSLHDPHVRPLVYTPLYHDVLYQHGFINERNEVLCSLKEFNKYRDYLRTVWCDEVNRDVEAENTFQQAQAAQYRAILKYESETTAQGQAAKVAARIANAKKFHHEMMEFKRKKQLHRDQMNDARLREWQAQREREIIQHIMQGIEKAKKNRDRVQALYDMRLQRRRDIMAKTARKFLETEERRKSDKAMMQAAYNKFLLEWLESKYVFCFEKLLEKRQMQADMKGSVKYKARKRQLRLEAYRKAMPSIQEKRKANTERLWAIVRKYAMRWLEKVRRRLNAPKDVKHESCWIGQTKGILDDTVKYLYQESGYEKLDDFILNIMKLKKQIQAQIELEEAEEAAMLAAEEQDETAPPDENEG